MPKSDRSIKNELQSLTQTLTSHDQVIAEHVQNKQKVIDEFVANNALFKEGETVVLSTPETEAQEVIVSSVRFVGNDILYSFSNDEEFFQTTLEGEGYNWN